MKDIKTLLYEANINEGKNEITEDNLLAILLMAKCLMDETCLYTYEIQTAKVNPTMSDGQIYDFARFLVDDKRAQRAFNLRRLYFG